jgi:hemoglobin-like flavoprotein
MVNDISYNTIARVSDSWEKLRQVKNYEELAGTMLYQRFFIKCPAGKALFGFTVDADPYSKELITSKRFIMQASHFIQMLDASLGMLGPDIELLTEIMTELGDKHVRYGVTKEMYPIMGECIIATLESVLSKKVMTKQTKAAWQEIYREMTGDMMLALPVST